MHTRAEPHKLLLYPFEAGYRFVSQGIVEKLIHTAVTTHVPASVLRLWCAFVECFHKRDLEFKNSLVIDPRLRRTMVAKSMGIRQITRINAPSLNEFFMPAALSAWCSDSGAFKRDEYHVKFPRRPLIPMASPEVSTTFWPP